MEIWELETKNGRIFRVITENEHQVDRLRKIIHQNKQKSYEVFIRIEVVTNGIHCIKDFEKLANSLV